MTVAATTNHLRSTQGTVRVALFAGAYNHIVDGLSLTLNRLVQHLETRGFEVMVFAPTTSNPPIDHAGTLNPIKSISLPGRPEYRVSFGLAPNTKRLLDDFRPSIVHIASPDFLGRSALMYAKRRRIPAVSSYHTHFSSYLKYYRLEFLQRTLWQYLRWFYNSCHQVYVPSHSIEEVLKTHGIDRGLLLWPRGVDTDHFSPSRRSPDWRQTLGIGDGEIVVSFVSRLVLEKGLHVFADVVRGLNQRGIPHRSIVVGDGPARAALEEQIPEAIFTGHLSGKELARAYASSDIFVFPSATETFGNVTLEAMASGLPTVCADAAGSSALVVHGRTGFLASPDDSPGFLNHVAHLISDSQLRSSMSEAARERAKEYAWDAVLERMVGYYSMLLNGTAVARNPSDTAATSRPAPVDSVLSE